MTGSCAAAAAALGVQVVGGEQRLQLCCILGSASECSKFSYLFSSPQHSKEEKPDVLNTKMI